MFEHRLGCQAVCGWTTESASAVGPSHRTGSLQSAVVSFAGAVLAVFVGPPWVEFVMRAERVVRDRAATERQRETVPSEAPLDGARDMFCRGVMKHVLLAVMTAMMKPFDATVNEPHR
jgi:hypothetical protein